MIEIAYIFKLAWAENFFSCVGKNGQHSDLVRNLCWLSRKVAEGMRGGEKCFHSWVKMCLRCVLPSVCSSLETALTELADYNKLRAIESPVNDVIRVSTNIKIKRRALQMISGFSEFYRSEY